MAPSSNDKSKTFVKCLTLSFSADELDRLFKVFVFFLLWSGMQGHTVSSVEECVLSPDRCAGKRTFFPDWKPTQLLARCYPALKLSLFK